MSFAGLLKQRADIYSPSDEMPTGPEAVAGWSDTPAYSDVPCRIQTIQVKERDQETGAVVASHNSFWAIGTNLSEGDRVVVDGVTYDVEGVDLDVAGAGHHMEATLKAVT